MKALASGRGRLPIAVNGETLLCLAAHALLWPQGRVLFVADVHLGKAASFRAAGVAMPGGHSAHDLDRIATLLDEHEAAHLVILGDLIHTRESYTAALDQKFRQFRARHADVAMTLVRGNHDRHAGDPPAHWGLQLVAEPFELGPFTCLHEPLLAVPPARTEEQHHTIELAGHLHPSLRLTTARESVALPCFWQHHRGIVLPSFGSVTGSSPISIDIGKSAVVVAGQQLHHLGSRG